MAGRSNTTFQKRQKELARQDRRREKAAKRVQRKMDKQNRGPGEADDNIDWAASTQEIFDPEPESSSNP